jgi:hypothetical protein
VPRISFPCSGSCSGGRRHEQEPHLGVLRMVVPAAREVRSGDRPLARDVYGLDTYANQIEVISSEQMIDAYSSVGLPINYPHWSFGKQFVATEQTYRRGQMGLAYEIVINSDPCIAYLMEENTLPMQALVIAHACYGHNSFFQGQLSLPHLDQRRCDHRLPGLRAALHRRVRGALRRSRGRDVARFLSCTDESRRGPLQATDAADACRGAASSKGSRRLSAIDGQ